MTFPVDVTTLEVVGTYLDASGNAVIGAIGWTAIDGASGNPIVLTADDTTIIPNELIFALDDTGSFDTGPLACSDSPNVSPTGFSWRVRELFAGGRTYVVELLSASAPGPVNIRTLAPISWPGEPVWKGPGVGPVGPSGSNGTNGTNGSNGTNGATWYSGSGVPGGGTGVNGDFYFRTATGDVYTKSAGSWGSPIDNLTGSTGATGATGATGTGSPYFAGRWYGTNVTGLGNGAFATTDQQPVAVPFICRNSHTFTGIGIDGSAAGTGGNLRFAIYNDDGTGKPGTLLLDAGTVSAASLPAEITISQALVAGTLYWLVVTSQGNSGQPTLALVATATHEYRDAIGSTAPVGNGFGGRLVGYTAANVSGAYPSPMTSLTGILNGIAVGFAVMLKG